MGFKRKTVTGFCSVSSQVFIPFVSLYAKPSNTSSSRSAWGIKSDLEAITTEGRPADCIACGACMKHCPQSIQIPDLMSNVVKMEESL